MRHLTHVLCAGAVALTALFGTAVSHADDASIRRVDEFDIADVYCPEEDSCTVDYDNGHWTVRLRAHGSW